ncbi:ABC transporter ATP-binding protein [Flagellimonas meridianipacifica]|uniref:Iron complex transport system ATP-binding protein n=1 Tax=Flagellimonas meridianipacifica TaxID=1080225 RepID=A0A2T0MAB5_9FLAO|nr:ABC transporter ATP-binding protein [Allomuricauda pacifica]PRX54419.1 iron complex transport system ATP-binding protein [Allomuricauda pacifica]
MDVIKNQILNVDNLSIGYPSITIAKNISFSLEKGSLCAIVGINGVGKSTLLRTLGGLQAKKSGEIEIDNQKLESLSTLQLAQKRSMVLTEQTTSKNLTVQELIALGRQPHTNWLGRLSTNDKKRIQQSIRTFLLDKLRYRKCHELSDGQFQRVLIARAMAQDTPLILLDEPTTHLDLHHKVQILKLLQQLAHEQNKTILFTTHEIDLAIQTCDSMLILDGNQNPFGEPCQLIEEKHFNTLFPSDMVQFDATTGTYKVKK